MKHLQHLCALCVAIVALMLTSCSSTPTEKVVDSLNEAIERAEKAKSRKTLDASSKILLLDMQKAMAGLSYDEQQDILNSSEVSSLQGTFNKIVFEKRKVLK
ncbi:MAG: hypothetical protein MJY95_00395 [Bacteroidaceae bacterium]|nr:hypothetical protein [Bacteroidaceae bacterium]